jgi:hypothetical protein
MPHTTSGVPNAVHQADLLFLPNDGGFRYLLVVVDIATRKCDAEPIKSKDSAVVKTALIAIYKRKILKHPLRIEVDAGTEFKGQFEKHFKKTLRIFTKVAGRHRSQAVVETKNGQIKEILNKAMLSDEINNDATSRKWVYIVPKVVKLINEHFAIEAKMTPIDAPVKTDNFTKDILDIGTKVRVQLDNPLDYVDGAKLHGKFRKGDIRYEKKISTVTDFYLRPNQPPMYAVNDNSKVAYTKYALQIVKGGEVAPLPNDGAQQYAQRVTDKRKIKGVIEYLVEWEDSSESWELRKTLINEIPDLIKEYEKSLK